jgi:hypothetical protein
MSESAHERIVLLNRIVSRSVTTAPEVHKPDTHGLEELLNILNSRRTKGFAIEYLGGLDDEDEDRLMSTHAAFLRRPARRPRRQERAARPSISAVRSRAVDCSRPVADL